MKILTYRCNRCNSNVTKSHYKGRKPKSIECPICGSDDTTFKDERDDPFAHIKPAKEKRSNKVLFNFYCFGCSSHSQKYFRGNKVPKVYKCMFCGSKDTKLEGEKPTDMKLITSTTLNANKASWIKRRRTEGMEKEVAERFYKDSIDASKERQKSGHEHYKKVSMDVDYHIKNGIAKVPDDGTRAKNIEVLRKKNQEVYSKVNPELLTLPKYKKK